MTYEQMKMHHFGAPCACERPISTPFMPDYLVHTPVQDNMETHEQGANLTPDKFNGLSCKDVQMFHQFRNSDAAHRADAIASTHRRATKLRDIMHEQGTAKFTSNYKLK